MAEIVTIPIVNSLRFVLQAPAGQIVPGNKRFILDKNLNRPGVYFQPFFLPVKIGDVTPVHIRTNYATNNAEIRRISDNNLMDTVAGVEKKDFGTFREYQFALDWTSIAAGEYKVLLKGSNTGFTDYLAESEPIVLSATTLDTVLLEWYNFENNFDIDYQSGVTFQIRIPGYTREAPMGGSEDVFLDSQNQPIVIEDAVYNLEALMTYKLPDWLHKLITHIMIHDYKAIDGVRVVREGQYEWEPAETYNLSKGKLVYREYDYNYQNLHDSGDRVTPPLAATDLTLDAVSSTQIDLISWTINQLDGDNIPNADYQEVIRDGVVIATKSAGATSHSDTGLTPETAYSYKIRTWKNGLFADSAVASATTIIPNPLQVYGSALEFWFRSDPENLVFNGSLVAQENDLSGKGRHVYNVNGANQPYHNSNQSTANGILDGHDAIYYFRTGADPPRWSANAVGEMGAGIATDYDLFLVIRYLPGVGGDGRFHISDNKPGQVWSSNVKFCVYEGFSGKGFFMNASHFDNVAAVHDGTLTDVTGTGLLSIRFRSPENTAKVFLNGQDISDPNQVNRLHTTNELIESVRFGVPNISYFINRGIGSIRRWESFLTTDISNSKFNQVHDYFAERYPSLGIVNPNL